MSSVILHARFIDNIPMSLCCLDFLLLHSLVSQQTKSVVLRASFWPLHEAVCVTQLLCDTANLEVLGPVKHDLYESLMAWERAPAKRINHLFSAEWEALTSGHSQGDRIRHQARSTKQETV